MTAIQKQKESAFLNQKGTTVVEFAVIASILFVILFGILEFGFIFMQEHFVANAAREGVRVGIRANNYNCFAGDTEDECTVDRETVIIDTVRDYLSTFYAPVNIIKPIAATPGESDPDIKRIPDENSTEKKTLSVTVEVNNFFPPILSSLASLLPGTGITLPTTISQTVTGEYEDPDEP